MKRIIRYITVVMISILVFYFGAGLNIIHYCCDRCRNNKSTVTAISDISVHPVFCCNEVINNNKVVIDDESESCCFHAEKSSQCTHKEHTSQNSSNCCSFERLSFDWDTHYLPKLLTVPNITVHQLFTCNLFGLFLSFNNFSDSVADLPNGPPLSPPSDYLSLLTILLI